MYYERLSLEVIAAKQHWQVQSPPVITGRSGVTHHFDFVAMNGGERLVFDICETLSETEVIKSFIKKLDTGASSYIICKDERIAPGASKLAAEYGLRVIHSNSIEATFKARELETRSQTRRLAAA